MVSLEVIAILLSGISISASLVYYASILRNANKAQEHANETREVQIFMQLYRQINNYESYKSWAELVNQGKLDYDEFLEKYDSTVNPDHYAKRALLWHNFNQIGELVRQGTVDSELVERLLIAPMIVTMWENWENIIRRTRERESAPDIWSGFEFLYNEIKRLGKEKGRPDYTYPDTITS